MLIVNKKIEIIEKNGSNGQTIVFVHGTSFGAWCWEENFSLFFNQKGYGTCSFSFRGNGRNFDKTLIHRLSLDDYAEDFTNIVKRMNDKPIVVAHSVGCIVVLKALQKYKISVSKIVLLTPTPNYGMLKEYLKFMLNCVRKKGLAKTYFSDRIKNDKLFMHYKSYLTICSRKVAIQLLKSQVDRDFSLDCDALVIGSMSDLTMSHNAIYSMGKYLHAKVVFFPNLCHAVMLDKDWILVAEEILEYIR